MHLDAESLEIYTWFFKNRARNKCLTFTLIGNLMPLLTGNVKSHLKNKFLINEFPFDERVCPEGNRSEAFLVSLENKAF